MSITNYLNESLFLPALEPVTEGDPCERQEMTTPGAVCPRGLSSHLHECDTFPRGGGGHAVAQFMSVSGVLEYDSDFEATPELRKLYFLYTIWPILKTRPFLTYHLNLKKSYPAVFVISCVIDRNNLTLDCISIKISI